MSLAPRAPFIAPLVAALLLPATALANPSEPPPNDVLATTAVEQTDMSEEDTSDETTTEETLPFDSVDLSELEAAADAHRDDRVTVDAEPRMSPVGVEDPFPDRLDGARPRDVWIPGLVSFGLAGASVVMARLALLPDCSSQDDITTCTAPTNGDIGVRGGRVFGALGFGAGGAVFGVVAGRQFGDWLEHNSRLSLAQKRRIAVGTGTTAVVLGTAGMIAGATLFGVSTRRAVDVSRQFQGVDTNPLTDEEYARLNGGLDQVRNARAGLMALVAAPTLVATGVSLLVHRPGGSQLSISPHVSRTYAGVSLRLRF